MNVIEKIRNRREELGIPLRKVAAATDIETSTYSKIEKGSRPIFKMTSPEHKIQVHKQKQYLSIQ